MRIILEQNQLRERLKQQREAHQQKQVENLRRGINHTIDQARRSTAHLENSLMSGVSPVGQTLPNMQPKPNRRSSLLPQKETVSRQNLKLKEAISKSCI